MPSSRHLSRSVLFRSRAEARASALLLALCGACSADGPESMGPPGQVALGTMDAAVLAPAFDAAPGAPPLTPVAPPPMQAGPIALTEAGGAAMPVTTTDAARDAGPIVITIPTRSVLCGSSECTTTSNRVCCDAWNRDTGFVNSPTCSTQAACTNDHPLLGDTNRAVMSECDEPSDCGADQVCCFVRYGAPISADLFGTELIGPGASRLCMDLSKCNAGATSFSGTAGVPLGVAACKTAADCPPGSQCAPEEANSSTTGKMSAARPSVLVCK
jgi:hypothetical protein